MSDLEKTTPHAMSAAGANLQPRQLVVFASGRGSNFQALLHRRELGKLSPQIAALVTNVPGCGAHRLAESHDIPVVAVAHGKSSREQHENSILEALASSTGINLEADPHTWIVLAGYMRLFSSSWIQKLYSPQLKAARMVNIHPSLLPSFPGVHSYRQALQYGVAVTGVTVHLVTEGLDDGPILRQKAFNVLPNDTEDTLSARGLELEHQLYADAIEDLATRPWTVSTPTNLSNARPRVVFGKEVL